MRKKAIKTHDVKIIYREPVCNTCGCLHFGEKCNGYKDGCDNYKPADAWESFCKNCDYPITSYEIIQAEELSFETRTKPPFDDDDILEIDGRDFTQCYVIYLEVDGKILIDDREVLNHEENTDTF